VAVTNYPASAASHLIVTEDVSMKRILGLLLQFLLCIFGSVLPALAHHSFAAEFDDKKPVKLEGTVVRFEFMNPHSWIHRRQGAGWQGGSMGRRNRQHQCVVPPRMAQGFAARG
jgi:hypothetical protein